MYFWLIVVAAYIVSVVLSVVCGRFCIRINKSKVYASDVWWSVCPMFNLLYAIVCLCYGLGGLGMPKWIIKLYGGR